MGLLSEEGGGGGGGGSSGFVLYAYMYLCSTVIVFVNQLRLRRL